MTFCKLGTSLDHISLLGWELLCTSTAKIGVGWLLGSGAEMLFEIFPRNFFFVADFAFFKRLEISVSETSK